jgi:Ca-activated chloride channel homolog
MSLFTYREPGRDGYFLLLLSPGAEMETQAYAAKDVVFVLDVSGSMQDDDKMEKARRALLFGVRGLQPDDRFNVIAFSGDTRLMETGLVRADRAGKARGVEFVQSLRARGGTNINEALVEALGQFPRAGSRPRLLVFITDGLPTVGVTGVDRILANVEQARRQGVRLFSFGVGYDVNTRLLDRLAAENGGTAEYVAPQEDLEVKVSSFFDKVNHPVLTNLRLDLGAVRTELVYPRALPDLFRGSQVALVGRYRNDRDLRNVTARLTGNASPARTFTYTGLHFPLRAERHDFLPRLWATRRVGWLMEQIRSHGENRELRDEVVDLGTRFGIVTPYTSYLALEPGERMVAAEDFSGVGRSGGMATGVAQGRAQGMQGRPAPAAAPAAVRAETGAAAVEQSRLARMQQDALSLEGVTVTGTGTVSSVRHVDGKTFRLRDGVWTDTELTDATRLPVTELRFGTDGYYEAVRRVPALARYFALGEQVAVIHEGRVYRVRP